MTGASSPVAVNTGEAYDYGFPYFNTASVNVAIPTPASNTRIDLVVLRANWSAQTVRITRIAGTEGAGAPSLVQSDGTTWDIPLAQASITTGGTITVTDTREFIHPNIAINTDMLDNLAVTVAKMAANSVDSAPYVDGSIDTVHLANNAITSAKILNNAVTSTKILNDAVDDTKAGNRVPQFYRRQGGSATVWSTAGTTAYTPTAVRMQCGAVVATQGGVAVTFPVAFSYAPVVLATAGGDVSPAVATNCNSITTTGFTVSASGNESVDTYWLAIGPE